MAAADRDRVVIWKFLAALDGEMLARDYMARLRAGGSRDAELQATIMRLRGAKRLGFLRELERGLRSA